MGTKEWAGIFATLLIAAIIAIWKWALPKIATYYATHIYNHSVGYRIVKDIETQLGKDASKVILEFMKEVTGSDANHGQRLNIIENNLGIGVYVCDTGGRCLYANDTLSDMFGLSRQEMVGSGWLANVKDRQKVFKEWMFAVSNGIPYRNVYTLVVDGVERRCSTEAEETRTDDGIILGYLGVVKYIKD